MKTQDEETLLLYTQICRDYSGRYHYNKIRGQYQDELYGTRNHNDIRLLLLQLEQIDIHLELADQHLQLEIELDRFLMDKPLGNKAVYRAYYDRR